MSTKFHIDINGNPAPCSALVKACPRGDESDHYSSPEQARDAFENQMSSSNIATISSVDNDLSLSIKTLDLTPKDLSSENPDGSAKAYRDSVKRISETVNSLDTSDHEKSLTSLEDLRDDLIRSSENSISEKDRIAYTVASEKVGDTISNLEFKIYS